MTKPSKKMTKQAATRTGGGASQHERIGLFYLWHLAAIGLIRWNADDTIEYCDHWQIPGSANNKDAFRVAIIDNGCARDHPNLVADRIEHADFTARRKATFFPTPTTRMATNIPFEAEMDSAIANRIVSFAGTPIAGANYDLSANFLVPDPERIEGLENPSYRFSAHGTACAGLVAARATAPGQETAPPTNSWSIKYSGVDPFAKVLAINTVYNHEYWPLTAALIHAVRADAKVILLPRLVPDMAQPEKLSTEDFPLSDEDPRHTRLNQDWGRFLDKLVFESVLEVVCQNIPTVVAAGNTGIGELAYPARLSTLAEGNNAFPLITVGAVTAVGLRASYSAGSDGDTQGKSPFLYAPSNDHETMSTDYQRFDDLSWRARNTLSEVAGSENTFCPYGVLAIDIPGPWGYDVMHGEARDLAEPAPVGKLKEPLGGINALEKAENSERSLYALFGGTSAASSIVAGTISQMVRAKPDITVGQIIDILRNTGDLPHDMEEVDPQMKVYGKPVEGDVSNALHACAAIEEAKKL